MHTYSVGDVEVIALLDTTLSVDPRQFFPSAGAKFHDQYPKALDEHGRLPMPITTFVIRSGGKTMLADSGFGSRPLGPMPAGTLDRSLADAGIDPGDVDAVVHTHLHIDHVGWNTVDDNGTPRVFFPNAKFMVQQPEWDFWMTEEQLAEPRNAHLVNCMQPVADSGQLELVDGEVEIAPGVTYTPTPGHTPGHACIAIESNGERGIVFGDLTHHPAQLDHPEWSIMEDRDPKAATNMRDEIFNAAGEDKRTIFAGHWPHPGIGYIQSVYGRRIFRPRA